MYSYAIVCLEILFEGVSNLIYFISPQGVEIQPGEILPEVVAKMVVRWFSNPKTTRIRTQPDLYYPSLHVSKSPGLQRGGGRSKQSYQPLLRWQLVTRMAGNHLPELL